MEKYFPTISPEIHSEAPKNLSKSIQKKVEENSAHIDIVIPQIIGEAYTATFEKTDKHKRKHTACIAIKRIQGTSGHELYLYDYKRTSGGNIKQAEQLMLAVIEEAKKSDATWLCLNPKPFKTIHKPNSIPLGKLIQFYERLGFSKREKSSGIYDWAIKLPHK